MALFKKNENIKYQSYIEKTLKQQLAFVTNQAIGEKNKNIILQNKINEAIDFINTWINYKNKKMPLEVSLLDLIYIKEILKGDD